MELCGVVGAATGVTRTNPYNQRLSTLLEGNGGYDRVRNAGEMGALAVKSVRLAVTPPFTWWRDMIVECSLAYRRTVVPLAISHSVYVTGFGLVLFGAILANLGVTDREAGAMFLIWSREIGTWITAMVFAGTVGSAVAADLGARKIREELDALAVLGVEQVRALVVPRVVACTIAAPVMAFVMTLLVQVVNFATAPPYLGFSHAVYIDQAASMVVATDLYFTMFLKNLVIGFLVGVIACYKGLSSRPGAEGVGRAVNETVVLAFFAIWLFNSVFNTAYFTLLPETSVLRG